MVLSLAVVVSAAAIGWTGSAAPAVVDAAGASPTTPASTSATKAKPNILLILTDDQRAGTEVGMPNVMAHIAAEGVTYPNSFVPTSWCCPSRASLLTGKFAHNDGVWENAANNDYGAWPAFHYGGEERDTIATRLNDAGYRTGLFGKYLNDIKGGAVGFSPPGWDVFEAFLGGGHRDYRLSSDSPSTRRENREYLTDALAKKTINFIARSASDEEPFFAYFSPFAPHYPYDPGPYAGATRRAGLLDDAFAAANWPNPSVSEEDVSDKSAWMRKFPVSDSWIEYNPNRPQDKTVEDVAEAQSDTLWGVDQAVGRIFAALRRTGQLDNTLIVFMSDNGYSWNDHRLQGKNTPYDSSIRVPMMVRFDAGGLGRGTVDERMVAANIDAHATMLDLAGVRPGRIDGVSMVGERKRDGVLLEAARWRGVRDRGAYCGWRTPGTLYVRYASGFEELYDYRVDPFELVNASDDPANNRLLSDMRERTREECSPTPPDFTWSPRAKPALGAPTNVMATASGKEVLVSWRAPYAVGRLRVTYEIYSSDDARRPVCEMAARTSPGGLRCVVRKATAKSYYVVAVSGKQAARSIVARVR